MGTWRLWSPRTSSRAAVPRSGSLDAGTDTLASFPFVEDEAAAGVVVGSVCWTAGLGPSWFGMMA